MAFRLLDRAQMSVTGTPGTGNITLGVHTAGYQTFVQAGLNNQDTFSYSISDGINWEYGVGTFTLATNTMLRTVGKTSAQSAIPLSLSSKAVVSACVRAEDVSASSTLSALTDVSVTEGAAINGYTLNWSNSTGRWVAVAPVSAGVTSLTLEQLTDVAVSSVTNGQALLWNSATSRWVNGTVASITLEQLTDVLITSVASNQVLAWNSTASKWENITISTGGSALAVSNNGTVVDSAATTLNFVNATSITTSAHDVTVTLPIGSGGTSSWTSLTFTSGTISSFGPGGSAMTYYTSDQIFTLTAGDFIEVQSILHKTAGTFAELVVSADGTHGVSMAAQGTDGNAVAYAYEPTPSAKQASNAIADNNHTGFFKIDLSASAVAGTSIVRFGGRINGFYTVDVGSDYVSLISSTVRAYVNTDNISNCVVRARVVNASTLAQSLGI